MCGIAGAWNPGANGGDTVRAMMDTLVHRGPDDEGTYHAPGGGWLGHRRLSIMDVEGGQQPIEATGSACVIVANGEIYNAPAIRDQLKDRHVFQTQSDSESALHLYREGGPEAIHGLDGMFGLAIADGDDLFLARDAIGIKPMYYGRSGQSFLFASELKALVGRAEDVREFAPGTWYHSRLGFRRYYEVPDAAPRPMGPEEAVSTIRRTLEAAVVKRLQSDVPLGTFLSGGLDSSLITAIVRKHVDKLHTFCVGFEGSRDLLAARAVADHLGTIHHEYILTIDEILAELPRILYSLESFDQDLVRSAIPCYFTSKMAAEHVKVVLSGEGADELFAGYSYHKDYHGRGPDALHLELQRSVRGLHNVNLQRVDRMTMAHSIEGRVPFLDTDLIAQSLLIPTELKLRRDPGGPLVEKWILRKAFEDLLPLDIIERDKQQFDEGTGIADAMGEILGRWMSPSEADRYARSHPDARLRSAEECVYHKLLCESFPEPEAVLANVARWTDRDASAEAELGHEEPLTAVG